MTLNFYLKDYKKENTIIIGVVSFNSKKTRFSTGIKIESRHWNKQKQQVKTSFNYSLEVNMKLEQIKQKLFQIQAVNSYSTPRLVVEAFKKPAESGLLVQQFEKYIEYNEIKNLSRSFYKGLNTLLNKIKMFTGRKKILISEVDHLFLENFKNQLEKEELNDNYIRRLLKEFLRFLKYCEKKEFEVDSSVYGFKLPSEKKSSQFALTADEVVQIETASNLSDSLENVKKMFLLQIYTGLRISDLRKISPASIDGDLLRIYQTKTKEPVLIPIHNKLKPLIENLHEIKFISSQKYNSYLKQLLFFSGVHSEVKTTYYSGNKTIEQINKKHEIVSSHVARRTFATLMNQAGVPIADIMKITGHKSILSFQKYIRTTEQQTVKNIKSGFDKLFK